MDIVQEQRRLRRQLESSGIRDNRVLDAVETTRRDQFLPEELRPRAYEDVALPIDCQQTISQPYIVARMTEALRLEGREKVLEVGTGSGYQAAILAELCAWVVTIERFDELARKAREVLESFGHSNIIYRTGDGTLGCKEFAPYDGVIVTAAGPDVPAPLFHQLKMGGRLVMPIGSESSQTLRVIEKQPDRPRIEDLCGCRFVKLIGDAGWAED